MLGWALARVWPLTTPWNRRLWQRAQPKQSWLALMTLLATYYGLVTLCWRRVRTWMHHFYIKTIWAQCSLKWTVKLVVQSKPSISRWSIFVKDKLDHCKVVVEHCLTKQMWTDINTKQKQGLIFRVFQRHIKGIPADYKDNDYFGKVPTSPPVSMPPLSKEQLASKECGGEQINSHILTKVRWTKLDQQNQESTLSGDRLDKEESLDMEVPLLTKGLELRAPIKMVNGRLWSPGVYQSLCLLGKTLEVAW